jgi:hypothetical protein
MAQSILIFDFGNQEEAAQQARHKVESWKQAFRLGDRVALKFERVTEQSKEAETAGEEKPAPRKKGAKQESAKKEESPENPPHVRILIRLNFSDHEKLSHQRWLDRIPAEKPFKSAKSETIRQAEEAFAKTSEFFDSLD